MRVFYPLPASPAHTHSRGLNKKIYVTASGPICIKSYIISLNFSVPSLTAMCEMFLSLIANAAPTKPHRNKHKKICHSHGIHANACWIGLGYSFHDSFFFAGAAVLHTCGRFCLLPPAVTRFFFGCCCRCCSWWRTLSPLVPSSSTSFAIALN